MARLLRFEFEPAHQLLERLARQGGPRMLELTAAIAAEFGPQRDGFARFRLVPYEKSAGARLRGVWIRGPRPPKKGVLRTGDVEVEVSRRRITVGDDYLSLQKTNKADLIFEPTRDGLWASGDNLEAPKRLGWSPRPPGRLELDIPKTRKLEVVALREMGASDADLVRQWGQLFGTALGEWLRKRLETPKREDLRGDGARGDRGGRGGRFR